MVGRPGDKLRLSNTQHIHPNIYTVVSRKYRPPQTFATLALVQNAGGAYTHHIHPNSIAMCFLVHAMLFPLHPCFYSNRWVLFSRNPRPEAT